MYTKKLFEQICNQVENLAQKGKVQMDDLARKGKEQVENVAQKGKEQVGTLAQKGKEQVDTFVQKEKEKKALKQLQKEFYQKVTIFLQRSNSCERSEYYASAVELNQLCKTMEEVSIDDIKNIEELEKINCKIDEILNNLGIN